ncbi:MAG TPA: PilZ domain-containing protein [Planctomycetota bacterium]|nr:PilZ domain-containing protein [Planctomycetota bacterium]
MAQSAFRAVQKNELRRSTRFQIDEAVPLVYKKGLLQALGLGRINEARAAVNLSEGGLLVRTHDRVQIGTKVRVRLEIEKFQDVVEAEGVVRWCFRGAGDGGHYYAGIRFTQVAAKMAAKISRLRGYFTSPEYRCRNAARRRRDPLGLGA